MRIMTLMALTLTLMFTSPALAADTAADRIKANVKKIVVAEKKQVKSVTVAQFKEIMDKQEFFFELVDIRTGGEFNAGHIAGALHLDRNKLEWMTPNKIKDPDVPVFVYCKGGNRGAMSALRLTQMGYTNVTNITGGIKAWANAGYPLYNLLGEFRITQDGFEKKPE